MYPSTSAGVRIAYARQHRALDIWILELDSESGTVPEGARPTRLTEHPGADHTPSISPDGTKVVFNSERLGTRGLWVKDLSNGVERPLFDSPHGSALDPHVSRDGLKVVFFGPGGLNVVPIDGSKPPERVGPGRPGSPGGWSASGKKIMSSGGWCVDIDTGEETRLLESSDGRIWQGFFCPDDRWIAFLVDHGNRSRIHLAPYRPGEVTPIGDSIPVTDGESWVDKPRWSPRGGMLYYTSDRDGYRCIYAQRIDRETGRSVGRQLEICHLHETRRSMLAVALPLCHIGVAVDKIVFVLEESTGNVWLADLLEE